MNQVSTEEGAMAYDKDADEILQQSRKQTPRHLSAVGRDQVAITPPQEAILLAAEELGEIREQLQRLSQLATSIAAHADRGEQLGETAIDDARLLKLEVQKIEEALLPLLAMPAQLAGFGRRLVELQQAVVALDGRAGRMERELSTTKALAGRSWHATSEMRGEMARLSGHVVETLRKLEDEAAARARLAIELAETKATAAKAQAEAEEASEWAEKTGKHHIEDLQRRASRGDEMNEQLVKQQLKDRARWSSTQRRVVLMVAGGVFSAAGLGVIAALLQRC